VDQAEIQAARPDFTIERFNAADANHDGLLSREEMRAAHGPRHGREMFTRMEKESSGGVDLAELQSLRSGMTPEDFARLDLDGDGQLSRQELKAGHRRHHEQGRPAPQAQPEG
jgi:Ca2+-binding EF-hand superfamily protein